MFRLEEFEDEVDELEKDDEPEATDEEAGVEYSDPPLIIKPAKIAPKNITKINAIADESCFFDRTFGPGYVTPGCPTGS